MRLRCWRKAMEGLFVCIAEKWELKQEVETMSVQAVEESKTRLAAPVEQVREHDLEREREEGLDYRTAELEVQSERIERLEAELRKIKAKLLELEAECEVN